MPDIRDFAAYPIPNREFRRIFRVDVRKIFAAGGSGLTFLRILWYTINTTCGFDGGRTPLVEAARFVWMHDELQDRMKV